MRKLMIACVAVFCTMGIQAQNWDINTLHKINSMDGKFVRNYSKAFSRSAPYISVGVPVAMAIYAGIGKDKELLKDAVYIGTSVAEAVVLTYGIKHMSVVSGRMTDIPGGYIRIVRKAVLRFRPAIRRQLFRWLLH